MSHELRTPLNSLLILSEMLADNPQGNLDAKQTEYAKTIHSAGSDLLELINEILDLSKIESGSMTVENADVPFAEVSDFCDRTFRHLAEQKQLGFKLTLAPELPRTMRTDAKRLQQILKNLLSNAFKFTEQGEVELTMRVAPSG
jgi:signal transduction histidine kinase